MKNNNKHARPVRLLACFILVLPAVAGAQRVPPSQLLDLSIEELSEVRVTSVSRRPEPLAGSAAAVFVITAEDIRRSGATSIPQALRLAPGLQVAQLSARRWAVSARGFNGEFANKLLVLIDGRSVYTPVHSGVNWDLRDVMLTDIERIEVIRGPGAAQWGANAVNGVINIITKSSRDTQGGLVSTIAGTELNTFISRWGGKLGDDASYRVFAKYFDRDASVTGSGDDAEDGWWQGRVGFRADWEPVQGESLMFQGDVYQADVNRFFPVLSSPIPPYNRPQELQNRARGGNLLARWTRELSPDNDFSLQGYLDWYEANPLQTEEEVRTFDVDFQQRWMARERHQVVWGLGYRRIEDDFDNTFTVTFEPEQRNTEVFSGFIQDTYAVTEDLAATLGVKVEENDYTGTELQPSMQFAWTPSSAHTLWGSVSKATRTPSRAESDIRLTIIDPAGTTETRYFGNPGMEAEELLAYELGYRVSPIPELFIDTAVFRHQYEDIRANRPDTPFVDPMSSGRLVMPLTFVNGVDGTATGLEFAARWQVIPSWRLDLAYDQLDLDLNADPTVAPGATSAENAGPRRQVSLFSRLDISPQWQLDAWLRHVDELPATDISRYTQLNLRIGWQLQPELNLSLVGENLLDDQHPEFSDVGYEIERAYYLRLDWRF